MSSNPQIAIGVTAIDKASAVLDAVDSKVKESADVVENASNEMATGSARAADSMASGGNKVISKWQQMKDTARANAKDIMTSMAGLTAGITSLAVSYNSLADTQIQVQSQQVSLARANDTLARRQTTLEQAALGQARAQEKLAKMQESGTATAQELAFANEDLRLKTQKLADQNAALATDTANVEAIDLRLADAQERVTETYAQFLAQVPAQMMSFGVATTSIMSMMGVSISATRIKYFLFGGTVVTTNGAITTSTLVASGAMGALRTSFKFLMAHPIVFVLAGAATVIMLVATNTFGLRDAFMNLGKTVYDFLFVHFRPMADAMKWFYDHILVPLGAAINSETVPAFEGASDATNEYANATVGAGTAIASTTDEIELYQNVILGTEHATSRATAENYQYLLSLGEIKDAASLSNEQIDLAANYLRGLAQETARQRQENFDLIATFEDLQSAIDSANAGTLARADMIREAIELEKKYGEAQRDTYDEMGRRRDGGGSGGDSNSNNRPSTDDARRSIEDRARDAFADSFNDNSVITRNTGSRLGIVTPHKGRSLDKGGVLYEDVYGIGMRTGTPHTLHAGETVTPAGDRGIEMHTHVYLDSKEIAHHVASGTESALSANRRRELKSTSQIALGTSSR